MEGVVLTGLEFCCPKWGQPFLTLTYAPIPKHESGARAVASMRQTEALASVIFFVV